MEEIRIVPECFQIKTHLAIEWAAEFNSLKTWEALQKDNLERMDLISKITLSMERFCVSGIPWMAWITSRESPSRITDGNPMSPAFLEARRAALASAINWSSESINSVQINSSFALWFVYNEISLAVNFYLVIK